MIETSLPVFSIYLDKRKLVSYTVLAFVLGSFLGGTMWNFAGVYLPKLPPSDLLTSSSLMKFGSSEELANFIGTRPQEYYYEEAPRESSLMAWDAPPVAEETLTPGIVEWTPPMVVKLRDTRPYLE